MRQEAWIDRFFGPAYCSKESTTARPRLDRHDRSSGIHPPRASFPIITFLPDAMGWSDAQKAIQAVACGRDFLGFGRLHPRRRLVLPDVSAELLSRHGAPGSAPRPARGPRQAVRRPE